jgi:hypothetical protein
VRAFFRDVHHPELPIESKHSYRESGAAHSKTEIRGVGRLPKSGSRGDVPAELGVRPCVASATPAAISSCLNAMGLNTTGKITDVSSNSSGSTNLASTLPGGC